MEKPCANSKHKDVERLMRPPHVKPPNTNTLTAIQLRRGCGTRLVLCQWCPNKLFCREPERRWSIKSSVRLTMVRRSLKCLLRKLNQNTDSLGRGDAKPFNLALKESAVTSETHWSKPVTPPHPRTALNLSWLPHPYPLQPYSFTSTHFLPQILIFFLMTGCLGTGLISVITGRLFQTTQQCFPLWKSPLPCFNTALHDHQNDAESLFFILIILSSFIPTFLAQHCHGVCVCHTAVCQVSRWNKSSFSRSCRLSGAGEHWDIVKGL